MTKKVFVSGCFDMLHSGHIAFFREAASYGDLYVALGSDRTVNTRRTVDDPAAVLIGVHQPRERQLLEVAQARRTSALFPGTVQGRHQDGHQYRDDGDHDQKFDQREAFRLLVHGITPTATVAFPWP